jgi:hypothetical protein
MIAPHRANRSKPPTQDRRRLTRYMRRWLVERFDCDARLGQFLFRLEQALLKLGVREAGKLVLVLYPEMLRE